MAEIVNLRRARKDRQRSAAERQAEDNRIRYGTPKSLREASRAEAARQARLLDGASLAPDRVSGSEKGRKPDYGESAGGKPPSR
jgi:hypothetical protein